MNAINLKAILLCSFLNGSIGKVVEYTDLIDLFIDVLRPTERISLRIYLPMYV